MEFVLQKLKQTLDSFPSDELNFSNFKTYVINNDEVWFGKRDVFEFTLIWSRSLVKEVQIH